MTNATQHDAANSLPVAVAANLPLLATVKKLPDYYEGAELTPSKIRAQIFDAEDRLDSQGRIIKGNGLAQAGAIIRRNGSRSVMIDVLRYGEWLAGRRGYHIDDEETNKKPSGCNQTAPSTTHYEQNPSPKNAKGQPAAKSPPATTADTGMAKGGASWQS